MRLKLEVPTAEHNSLNLKPEPYTQPGFKYSTASGGKVSVMEYS